MGFLDRMVTDLVKRSTGFNARPIVRAVGGKNILLLGGAAVAGMLAAEKFGSSGVRPSSQAPEAAPPPPPPVPRSGVEPPLPPLPPTIAEGGASPSSQPEDLEPPRELVYAIVRTMVAAALADGEMHAEEKRLIQKHLGESGLSSAQIQQIHKDLVLPASPAELSETVAGSEDQELLYRFGALVVLADENVTEEEKNWLHRLAASLAIPVSRRDALEEELFD